MKRVCLDLGILFLLITQTAFVSTKNINEHPFYISVFELNYHTESSQLQIIAKIFTNDFEKAINTNLNNQSNALVQQKIVQYFNQHLQLKINNQTQALHFFKTENKLDLVQSYFYVSLSDAPSTIQVTTDFLYEQFAEQVNIFHVYINDQLVESRKLTNPEKSFTITFAKQQPN